MGEKDFMKMMVMKKIMALSLGLCVATNVLHASVDDLARDLGTLKGKLGNLSNVLSTLGKKAGSEKISPTPGTGTSGKDEKDFAGKIDYLEIPNFEQFYRAFFDRYFKKAFADSRVGKLPPSWFEMVSVTDNDLATMKDTIGRAIFERNVLQLCRQYIEKNDSNRDKSGQSPRWVYDTYLSGVIKSVIDNKVEDSIQKLLTDTAQAIAQAIDDMFIHRERDPQKDLIDCTCLDSITHKGFREGLSLDRRIPIFQGDKSIERVSICHLMRSGDPKYNNRAGSTVEDPKIIAKAEFKPKNEFEKCETVIIKQPGLTGKYIFGTVKSQVLVKVELPVTKRTANFAAQDLGKWIKGTASYEKDQVLLNKDSLSKIVYSPDNTFDVGEFVILQEYLPGEKAHVTGKSDDEKAPWKVEISSPSTDYKFLDEWSIHLDQTEKTTNFRAKDLGKFMEPEPAYLGDRILDEDFKKKAKFSPDNIFDLEEIVIVEQPESAGNFIFAQVVSKSGDEKSPWMVHQRYFSLEKRNFSTEKLGKLKHPLALQIAYLVFETMHTTLFHAIELADRLIQLFDFTRNLQAEVVTKNKTKFKVGYDKVFEGMMKHIMGNEDKIKAGLFTGNQLKYDGTELELLFLGQTEPQPRMVIFGKKPDIYWSQGRKELWPDRRSHTNTPEFRNKPTDQELLYALWYQLQRHTCYSVGLLPENIIPVIALTDEVRAEVTEIEADRHVNKKVQGLLKAQAKGLVRVTKIVDYLLPKLKELKKPEKKATPLITITKIRNIIDNIDAKDSDRAQLQSITDNEWTQIASKIAADPAYDTQIKWIFKDAAIKHNILENFKTTPTRKDAAIKMFAAFDR